MLSTKIIRLQITAIGFRKWDLIFTDLFFQTVGWTLSTRPVLQKGGEEKTRGCHNDNVTVANIVEFI